MPIDPKQAFVRMDPAVYKVFEIEVTRPVPVIPKTELEAGFSLGVQHVLKVLRTGYVPGA